MKIAVIKTGGKQYKVKEGQVLKIEKLDKKTGEKVKFDTLLISNEDGSELNLGRPSLGEKVEGKISEHGKNDKVAVVKFKSKVRYRKNVGHRQSFTKVQVEKIG